MLLTVFGGCKKDKAAPTPTPIPKPTPSPTITPDFPTENMEGKYLWHGIENTTINGKDTTIYESTADEIDVKDDSTFIIGRDINYNGRPTPIYKLIATSDSELIFRHSKSTTSWEMTMTYKFKRNLLVWKDGNTVLFGVPGQTTKWAPQYQSNLDEMRLWSRIKTYYPTYTSRDTTIVQPDTAASAFLLFNSVSTYGNLLLAGADSTGVIYQEPYYDAGPDVMYIIGSIEYIVANNEISIYHSEPHPFGSTYIYATK